MNGITGFSESSWDIDPILMGVSSDWLSWLFITKLATYMVVTNIVQGGYHDPTNITRGQHPAELHPSSDIQPQATAVLYTFTHHYT